MALPPLAAFVKSLEGVIRDNYVSGEPHHETSGSRGKWEIKRTREMTKKGKGWGEMEKCIEPYTTGLWAGVVVILAGTLPGPAFTLPTSAGQAHTEWLQDTALV